MAWTPHYKLTNGQGADITPAIAARLINLSYEEQAEDKSDRLTLTLSDHLINGGRAELPDPDQPIRLEIGYKEAESAYFMGLFRVDEAAFSGPPDTVEVTASAAAMSDELRSPQTKSWDNTTLGDIAQTIASEHDLEARISDDLASVKIKHADQNAESPMAFLTRLTRQHDAVARPLGELLVVLPKGQAKSVSGRELPTYTLGPNDVSDWNYRAAMRRKSGTGDADKGGVKAYYHDNDKSWRQSVTVGSSPFEEIEHLHESEAAALKAAQAKFNENERSKQKLSVTIPGRPDLVTEAPLELSGWRPQIPTRWRIKRCTHSISGSAEYSTEIEGELL